MPSNAKPNLLLIMVDSLRPDRLGCGGHSTAATPSIDRLASKGAFMPYCICPMPSSVPSRASIFTGRFPHSHGLKTNDLPLPEDETTIAEILSEEGYHTAATPRLDPGCEKGFDDLEPLGDPALSETTGRTPDELAYHTTLVTDSAVRWLDRNRESSPWFLWVDYESTHEPWLPPEPWRSMFDTGYEGEDAGAPRMYEPEMGEREVQHLRALYDGEVALVDEDLGRLLACVEAINQSSSNLIMLVSDHGVFLGEGGFFKKPPLLLDPLIRCTFIASLPGVIPPGARLLDPCQICDVMPTAIDLLGLPPPPNVQGRSLKPVMEGSGSSSASLPAFVEFCEYKGTAVKAVRTRQWKYIYNRSIGHIPWSRDYSPGEVFDRVGVQRELLFDLDRDPEESTNLVDSRGDVVAGMKSLLIDWLVDTED